MPPREIYKLPMQNFIKQLLIFSPANSKDNEFFHGLAANYFSTMRNYDTEVDKNHQLDDLSVFDKLPANTIISIADKNVGIALLPTQWYVDEYYRQQDKGGYETIEITEKQCIDNLEFYIKKFKDFCSPEQRVILKGVWPRTKGEPRIGILKLVPKVHKLKSKITTQSWKELRGRPIRGAEQCPINAPSIALCKLIQGMLGDLKESYQSFAPNSILSKLSFPLIKGCDAYSTAINDIKLMTNSFSSTFLLSADFSDAYTLSIKRRLQDSINYMGRMLGYQIEHISLI